MNEHGEEEVEDEQEDLEESGQMIMPE